VAALPAERPAAPSLFPAHPLSSSPPPPLNPQTPTPPPLNPSGIFLPLFWLIGALLPLCAMKAARGPRDALNVRRAGMASSIAFLISTVGGRGWARARVLVCLPGFVCVCVCVCVCGCVRVCVTVLVWRGMARSVAFLIFAVGGRGRVCGFVRFCVLK
jgi:hypothetical protein